MLIVEKLQNDINTYLARIMSGGDRVQIVRPKAIHDSIHQTNFFSPHEVALIDLPIVQRLRRISQTDVASYVYPSANHSRFEHTLGVTVLAGRFIEALWKRPESRAVLTALPYDNDYFFNHVRVAAILHDVGHGPFSHLSEQLYAGGIAEIRAANRRLQGASPHEILSFYITISDSMKNFNKTIFKEKYDIEIDLELVADIIVGNAKDHKEIAFLVEIVNGGFDADKLDYMLRDAHATGLQMSLDLSRLLYALTIYHDNESTRLGIDMRGALALEQIIFNKMTLTASVYHHHKVRAAGCMLKNIINKVMAGCSPALYFQKIDDDIITSQSCTDDKLNINFRNRCIPKRALTISHKNIDPQHKDMFSKFMSLCDNPTLLEKIKETIIQQICEDTQHNLSGELWIDVPKTPKFKEAITTKVIENGREITTLKKLFPIDDWVTAYSQNKWKAYVFCYDEHIEAVAATSKHVFQQLYNLKFD